MLASVGLFLSGQHVLELFLFSTMASLLMVLVGCRLLLQGYRDWAKEAELLVQPRLPFDNTQPWREPTGIKFLEDLKSQLLSIEDDFVSRRNVAVAFLKRVELARNRGNETTWWFRLVESRQAPRGFSGHAGQHLALCQQLDRLWAGDAHLEIEDRRQKLQVWNRYKADLSPDDKATLLQYDKEIIDFERQLRDLAEIVRRAQERAKVSPNEAKLREAREIHVNDVHHDMTKAFLGVLSKMEIFRTRAELKQQVTDDPSFTKDEKEELFAKIDELAAAADSKTVPARQSKPGAIYKEG